MFYFSKQLTATVTGRRLVSVTCQKCRTGYWYELSRVGGGRASAPYYLAQQAAQARADRAAQKDLARRLEQDVELVPCPKCNWVNQDLVDRYRQGLYRRAPMLIAVCVAVGVLGYAIIAGITGGGGYHPNAGAARTVGAVLLAVGLSSPVWVLLPRRILRLRVDPNATYPRPPALPPGTPPALVERRDPQGGGTYLEEVVRRATGPAARARVGEPVAILNVDQLYFPPVCCVCLGAATRGYKSPFRATTNSDIPVPICDACSRRLTVRWYLLAPLWAVAAAAAAALVALAIPDIDATGRWITFTVVGLFGVVLAVAIVPNRYCRPYRFKVIDNERAVIEFAARNPAYTRMVIEQAGLPDEDDG